MIVAHEVTNVGHDRTQLANMAKQAKEALASDELSVVADRGYFKSEEILACEEAGITTYLPKPQTSGNQAKGQFGRDAFRYIADDDEYECPAGQRLVRHTTRQDKGKTVHSYWTYKCRMCLIKAQCTTGVHRRMTRWDHEAVLENVQARLDRNPHLMRVRRSTVEHPFGTLKAWMGSTHFLTKTLDRVNTEMSLHVLAYNMKRMMQPSRSNRNESRSDPKTGQLTHTHEVPGGKYRVITRPGPVPELRPDSVLISCIEDPPLIRKILGHIQRLRPWQAPRRAGRWRIHGRCPISAGSHRLRGWQAQGGFRTLAAAVPLRNGKTMPGRLIRLC
jgi:hypothetical protein